MQLGVSTFKGPALGRQCTAGHCRAVIERLWLTIAGVFCGVSGTAGSSASLSAAIQHVESLAEAVR